MIRKLSEAQVKLAVSQYLQFQQNLGKLMFLRLNSGEIIAMAGESRRRIKLCDSGTADFVVFQGIRHIFDKDLSFPYCEVTFIEVKSSKGKQTLDQVDFEDRTYKQNCRYFIIRDADEIIEKGLLESPQAGQAEKV